MSFCTLQMLDCGRRGAHRDDVLQVIQLGGLAAMAACAKTARLMVSLHTREPARLPELNCMAKSAIELTIVDFMMHGNCQRHHGRRPHSTAQVQGMTSRVSRGWCSKITLLRYHCRMRQRDHPSRPLVHLLFHWQCSVLCHCHCAPLLACPQSAGCQMQLRCHAELHCASWRASLS